MWSNVKWWKIAVCDIRFDERQNKMLQGVYDKSLLSRRRDNFIRVF